ncbi:NADPH:quinone oxidoreductase [Rhodococcus sp. SC4]|uniref:NADPH:quinone oxidoreductase family protein n=1 Tax=unclassified Rhodococcus (in: high G+C Gram-positive bacteria) TaxID=192944 RepID=UPI00076A58AC|nr:MULTISPECIES: NADPH:quinone oxidoreductase family protein [unclassified Rhodococcus (in: high G+C Gram-positive bacteria)]KXF49264.1 NADPH:quinone oxidoreductase [Rhodococcus sp. SC4]KXX63133.1 NADPH:quinone oxidoreductase [Rhodococcus sp. LB1]PBC56390.1 NADPH:quinone oxidoreductase [Rhodococcus sp. ACPA1]
MRAARCEVHGKPDTIVIREVPDPVAGPGEVVVGVEAASVNYPDVLIAADRYQVTVPTPFTAGSEFAGRVLSVGPEVDDLAPGAAVMGTAFAGAFAERITVARTALSPVPAGLDMVHAAAFNVTYRTAYHAVTTFGGLEPGAWVVILGAAGGVGSAAIDIATRLGGKVIAAVSTPERAEACRSLGAVETIAYDGEDLKQRIKEITGTGADVVIDPVGGSYSEQALRAIAWGGRFVCVGFAQGDIPRIPLNLVLLKGAIVRGFEIRTLASHLPDAVDKGRREIERLVAQGMTPFVSEVYSLDEAPLALTRVAERRTTGKIVIDMSATT